MNKVFIVIERPRDFLSIHAPVDSLSEETPIVGDQIQFDEETVLFVKARTFYWLERQLTLHCLPDGDLDIEHMCALGFMYDVKPLSREDSKDEENENIDTSEKEQRKDRRRRSNS